MPIITIDGPTASGKSSVAQALAQRFGFWYLNTGLLFRALAHELYAIGYTEKTILNPTLPDIQNILNPDRLVYQVAADGTAHIIFDGTDITTELKNPTIAQGASLVSTHKDVREAMVHLERAIASTRSCVIDGRDCGSVVFPHAEIKIFLTAPLTERARRFAVEQQQRGVILSPEEALTEVRTRDERDSTRAIAPLCIPEGALVIDSGSMNLESTIDRIEQIIRAQRAPTIS